MDTKPLRIALLCTPRSGNNWLRLLLGDAIGIPTIAVHELTDDVLADLPPECIVAIHWRRDADFERRLQTHGFRVLTMARHPCDVLMSILQFAVHDSESDRWLLGRGGDESSLFGAMPCSRAFVEYAKSDRARELFGVGGDWWVYPGASTIQYEELVRNPVGELGRLVTVFSPESNPNLSDIVARHNLSELRITSLNNHFWKGTPGHWRQFLPTEIAREIFDSQRDLFQTLGYACDPDPNLTNSQADRNWIAAIGPSLRAALCRGATSHILEREALRAESDGFARELRLAKIEAAEERARMVPFEGLQGFSVKIARVVQKLRDRVAKPR